VCYSDVVCSLTTQNQVDALYYCGDMAFLVRNVVVRERGRIQVRAESLALLCTSRLAIGLI
jgi:hypothetical protein